MSDDLLEYIEQCLHRCRSETTRKQAEALLFAVAGFVIEPADTDLMARYCKSYSENWIRETSRSQFATTPSSADDA